MSLYRNSLVITNRHLCNNDFYGQIQKIVEYEPKAIILREKDLELEEYEKMATRIMEIAKPFGVDIIIHTHIQIAKKLDCRKIHLPFNIIENGKITLDMLENFDEIGVSVHSLEEGRIAIDIGATYLTYSPIFATKCKPNVEPKGLEKLKSFCQVIPIPVFALGGITEEIAKQTVEVGAAGYAMMSQWMRL